MFGDKNILLTVSSTCMPSYISAPLIYHLIDFWGILHIIWLPFTIYMEDIIQLISYQIIGLVTYNTVYKGTSKLHITDEQSTHFAVHIYPSIFGIFEKHQPNTLSTLSKIQWYNLLFLIPMSTQKCAPPFFQFFIWFQPK